MGDEGKALLSFTGKLILFRRAHIVFHRHRFFLGQIIPGTEVKDVVWLRPDGAEISETDWGNAQEGARGAAQRRARTHAPDRTWRAGTG